jgi:hypothetical protein
MDPLLLRALLPLAAIAVVAFVVSIPLIGITVRFAAKPFVEALTHFKQAQIRGQTADQTVLMQDRRISLLEAELQQVQTSLQRVIEGEEFRRQLEAGRTERSPGL